MENITCKKMPDEQGLIIEIEIGGMLVLENSPHLKKELVSIMNHLSNRVKIRILNPDGLDLSCIQLLLAFIKHMDENHVTYSFDWMLDDDQKVLLENVGLSNELFIE
jgi:hypothetical protein